MADEGKRHALSRLCDSTSVRIYGCEMGKVAEKVGGGGKHSWGEESEKMDDTGHTEEGAVHVEGWTLGIVPLALRLLCTSTHSVQTSKRLFPAPTYARSCVDVNCLSSIVDAVH